MQIYATDKTSSTNVIKVLFYSNKNSNYWKNQDGKILKMQRITLHLS